MVALKVARRQWGGIDWRVRKCRWRTGLVSVMRNEGPSEAQAGYASESTQSTDRASWGGLGCSATVHVSVLFELSVGIEGPLPSALLVPKGATLDDT